MKNLFLYKEELKEIVAKALADCYFYKIDNEHDINISKDTIQVAINAAQLAVNKINEKLKIEVNEKLNIDWD